MQSEHLLKAVKSMSTTDLIAQRALVKTLAFQGHVGRSVRLVENQFRAVLFGVQEKRVEIDPISSAPAWNWGYSVWRVNRYQPH